MVEDIFAGRYACKSFVNALWDVFYYVRGVVAVFVYVRRVVVLFDVWFKGAVIQVEGDVKKVAGLEICINCDFKVIVFKDLADFLFDILGFLGRFVTYCQAVVSVYSNVDVKFLHLC